MDDYLTRYEPVASDTHVRTFKLVLLLHRQNDTRTWVNIVNCAQFKFAHGNVAHNSMHRTVTQFNILWK